MTFRGRTLAAVGAIALVIVGFVLGGAAVPVTITGAFGIITLLWTQSLQREAELEKQLSTERREMAKSYLGFLAQVADQSKAGSKVDPTLVSGMRRWSFDSMLLASDDALLAHARFIRMGSMKDVDSKASLAAVADVILALRKDAAPRTRLTPRQLLGAFVNEPLDDEIFDLWAGIKKRMDL